jgi:hypothetical protein
MRDCGIVSPIRDVVGGLAFVALLRHSSFFIPCILNSAF